MSYLTTMRVHMVSMTHCHNRNTAIQGVPLLSLLQIEHRRNIAVQKAVSPSPIEEDNEPVVTTHHPIVHMLESNQIKAPAQRSFRPQGTLTTGCPDPRDITKDVQGGKIPVKGQNCSFFFFENTCLESTVQSSNQERASPSYSHSPTSRRVRGQCMGGPCGGGTC